MLAEYLVFCGFIVLKAQDGLEAIGQREIEAPTEFGPSVLRRAKRVRNLGALLQVNEALRVRRDSHSQADERDSVSH